MLEVDVEARLGGFQIKAAFQTPEKGITAMLGPSGAGKSSLLAMVAGSQTPASGRIALGGRILLDTKAGICLPSEKRRLGVVHQDALLFPHMPVAKNLRYGLKRAKRPANIGFDDIVSVLAIEHLLDRRPQHLSGGERQRVALGRAMLSQPDLLLLDEPVSALDAALRADILGFVRQLNQRFGLPMLVVTHMVEEARLLADHVILLDRGQVAAQGDADTLLTPASAAVGQVVRHDMHHDMHHDTARTLVRFSGEEYWLPLIQAPPGSMVRIQIEKSMGGKAPFIFTGVKPEKS